MTSVSKFLQMILSWALLGAVIMTFIGPSVSRLLITAPKSFGMNCEPAASWSMQTLITQQIIGLALGVIFSLVLMFYMKSKQKKDHQVATPANV